jgi:hypothetical protein
VQELVIKGHKEMNFTGSSAYVSKYMYQGEQWVSHKLKKYNLENFFRKWLF